MKRIEAELWGTDGGAERAFGIQQQQKIRKSKGKDDTKPIQTNETEKKLEEKPEEKPNKTM